jgi:hypothetical protein
LDDEDENIEIEYTGTPVWVGVGSSHLPFVP